MLRPLLKFFVPICLLPVMVFAQLPAPGSSSGQSEAADPTACSGPMAWFKPECQAAQANGENDTSQTTASPQPRTDQKNERSDQNVDQIETNQPTRLPMSANRQRNAQTGQDLPEPPAPPTEFQRFVAASTGQLLPIFGVSLFDKAPSTFAPVDRVPVTADYQLGPGDEILLRVWGQVSLSLKLTVDRSGSIFIPQVGTVDLTGIEFRQLPGYLKSQLSRVYRNFDLTVSMGQLRSIQLFVVGQARRPGSYTVSSLSSLVNALFACGGPSAQGSMRRIQLKRGSQLVTEMDLYDLLLKGDKTKDARLNSGDVVYIPPVEKQVAIAGSVRNPGIYELASEKTVADVIQLAGGLSTTADLHGASLERIQQRSSREAISLQLGGDGLAMAVADGDFVNIRAIPARFVNTVTLRGNVATPGRFPWRPGMRIRDVIPDKESLITRNYWREHNLLVGKADDFNLRLDKPQPTTIDRTVPEINWSYAVIERQVSRDLSTEMIPFHLGSLLLGGDETQNLELQPGDVITIFSQSDVKVPQNQQTRLVRLEGEFGAAGYYTVRPGETLGALIARAGGLTLQAYLYGSELFRDSTKKEQKKRLDDYIRELDREIQQVGTAKLSSATSPDESSVVAAQLNLDQQAVERLRAIEPTGRIVLNLEPNSNDISKLSNMALEDGDRFMVPARPATVNVIGAVYNQGSFIHAAADKTSDYLREAGGFNRQADKSRVFIIRADGTVVPKQKTRRFESISLYPGDSLTVPDLAFKTSVLKGLRDWTQVFSQMALGAAAINVLK